MLLMEEKEVNPLDERKEIMQEVIDRHIQFGNKYAKALKKFHEKFKTDVLIETSILNQELPAGIKVDQTTNVGGATIRTYGKKITDN